LFLLKVYLFYNCLTEKNHEENLLINQVKPISKHFSI